MKIAIDLSPLQGPHRMRGIGYTVIHFINNISQEDRAANEYVFYVLPDSLQEYDPLDPLDLQGFTYELKELKKGWHLSLKLPGKLRYLTHGINEILKLLESSLGDSRMGSLKGVDIFLQCDQSQTLPRRRRKTRLVVILYDVIPYILEWDYLWDYKTSKARGYTWKGASIGVIRRYFYKRFLKSNVRRADLLLAISESTAKDFMKLFRFNKNKIKVVPLGIPELSKRSSEQPDLIKYRQTSWGYFPVKASLAEFEKPFLLFVGGADRRRKLEDLVGAFNMLRAQGYDIKLVLVGDSMKGPDTVSTADTQRAIMGSSYLKDIIFMGFASDETREWLYEHALAFVFPSRYEGFGLPVLEAMQYGTPVISYDNAATKEVAGDYPMYASSSQEIVDYVHTLLKSKGPSDRDRAKMARYASSYSWRKTSQSMMELFKR